MRQVTLYTVQEHQVLSHGDTVELCRVMHPFGPVRAEDGHWLEMHTERNQVPVYRIMKYGECKYVAIDPVLERFLREPYEGDLVRLTHQVSVREQRIKQNEAEWCKFFQAPWYKRLYMAIARKRKGGE